MAESLTQAQLANDLNGQLSSAVYDPNPVANLGTVIPFVRDGKAFWQHKNETLFWNLQSDKEGNLTYFQE